MRAVLVDLKDDREGWVPLEVEYLPASGDRKMEYQIIERHPELSSPFPHVARERGVRLAHKLRVTYIAHHL